MKFKAWTAAVLDNETLKKDYDSARGIGAVSVGDRALFFRKKLSFYYVPYENIDRCFRRVSEVPAQMGCCMGSYDRESLIIEVSGKDPVDMSMPDTRAARAVIEELRKHLPDSKIGIQKKSPAADECPAT